jgi:hypothetical protein
MKNYTYGWKLKDMGYVEIPNSEYTNSMCDTKAYIAVLSNAIVIAKCGWDSVEYKAMRCQNGDINEFMVLCVDGCGERYIPISGNSKGCNFSVLGENLW